MLDNSFAIGKFRSYVCGRSFTVVTGHPDLRLLASLKYPSGHLGRWMLHLQELVFTV